MVTFSVTFADSYPGFQDHDIFKVEYHKNLRTKLLYIHTYIHTKIYNAHNVKQK